MKNNPVPVRPTIRPRIALGLWKRLRALAATLGMDEQECFAYLLGAAETSLVDDKITAAAVERGRKVE